MYLFPKASSRRPFTDNSQLKLCNYAPKCSKKDSCHRAHNKEELESWQSTLCDTTREYSEVFTLKICMHAAEICAKGLSCRYAHSQKELDSWNEHLSCRSSSGKLLEMCKRNKDCTYGDRCRYAHNSKELRSWKSGERLFTKYAYSENCIWVCRKPIVISKAKVYGNVFYVLLSQLLNCRCFRYELKSTGR